MGTFAVPIDKSMGSLRMPCSFDTWFDNLDRNMTSIGVKQEVATQIKGNDSLLQYIKGLIRMCRDNPDILNKQTSGKNVDNHNKYQGAIAGKTYRTPTQQSRINSFRDNLLASVNNYNNAHHGIADNFYNVLTSGVVNNAAYITPNAMTHVAHSFPLGLMGGGGAMVQKTPSSGFAVVYAGIKRHLKNFGLDIHQDDNVAIESAITQVNEQNDRLARLAELLTRLVKVCRAYGLNINSGAPISNIHIKEINSVEKVDHFLRRHALKIRSHMRSNLKLQHNIYNDFYGNVIPTLLDCNDEDTDIDTKTVFFGNNNGA